MQHYRPPIFTNLENAKTYLNKHNYVAINVISKHKTNEYLNNLQSHILSHDLQPGLLKTVGHTKFMNNIRKEPKIINAFQYIWNSAKLLTSYDGAGYMIPGSSRALWPHVDINMSNIDNEPVCYQGLISLISNNSIYDGGFVIWEMNITDSIEYVKKFPNNTNFSLVKEPSHITPKRLIVPPGTLILWNSRMIHCNIAPHENSKKNRAVLYVCMLPMNLVSKEAIEKLKYFKKNKITSKHNLYYPEAHI